MASFWLIVAVGLVWMALTGNVSLGSFAFGIFLGAVVWRLEDLRASRSFTPLRALRLIGAAVVLVALFLRELLESNFEQLLIVYSPRIEVEPRWIHMRTALRSPSMRALLGLMVAMTPGTVYCEEQQDSDGGYSIGIHALNASDEDGTVERIRKRLEAPLLRMEAI
jgi:multicomponent Na+:H+ antiporter subunit E